jgi:HEAT repeat protein
MPIKVTCPTCSTNYALPDNRAGHRMQCRKCGGLIPIPGVISEEDDDIPELEATAPREPRRGPVDDRRERERDRDRERNPFKLSPSRYRRRRRDDGDDDDRDVVPGNDGSKQVAIILFAVLGGVFLLCAGGAALVVYSVTRTAERVVDFARHVDQQMQLPPILTIDDALAYLRNPDHRYQRDAADWLKNRIVEPRRQAEVSRALNPLLDFEDTRGAAIGALETWATAENVPGLLRTIDAANKHIDIFSPVWGILGRLKDPRAIPILLQHMERADAFIPDTATGTLRHYGRTAENEVLAHFKKSQNRSLRNRARGLLRDWNSPLLVDAVLVDLDSNDIELQGSALNDLGRLVFDVKLQPRVSAALNGPLNNADKRHLRKTIELLNTWATADNVPGLVASITGPKDVDIFSPAWKILARLKDQRALPILIQHLSGNNAFLQGAAEGTLRDFGPTAQAQVAPLLNHPDVNVRRRAMGIIQSWPR